MRERDSGSFGSFFPVAVRLRQWQLSAGAAVNAKAMYF